MQLFPSGIAMDPKTIKIYRDHTFGLVFKTGTVVICKRSLKGEMMIVARLFQSSEALKLVDSKTTGFDLPHQTIEFLEAADPNCIRALILSTPEQIDLVTMKLNQDVVEKQVSQYYRTQGEIVSFAVHPSLEYILALSKLGSVYIFNIADGEIRGKISVIPDSRHLILDPSGLFFAVATPSETVQLFEVGTGKRCFEFTPQFGQVGEFEFTQDAGGFVIADGSRNNVKFYTIDASLSILSRRVLLEMQKNPAFWHQYPIDLNPKAIQAAQKSPVKPVGQPKTIPVCQQSPCKKAKVVCASCNYEPCSCNSVKVVCCHHQQCSCHADPKEHRYTYKNPLPDCPVHSSKKQPMTQPDTR